MHRDPDPSQNAPRSGSRARPGRVYRFSEPDSQLKTTRNTGRRFASQESLHHLERPQTALGDTAISSSFLPRDEPGEELSETARVWQVYTEVARKTDELSVERANRSVDVLLTGLFSAVLTTFIIQSYQLMIPDPAETTNTLLVEIIALQYNRTASAVISASGSSTGIRWVNGLWFAALSCSLSTALISMLAKQWLSESLPNLSGSSRHRARKRQSKQLELEKWHVPAVIDALPFLMHVALLLFFAGLILFLRDVDTNITIVTSIIVAFAYLFYCTSIWLPLLYPECPYRHPISEYIHQWIQQPRRPTRPVQIDIEMRGQSPAVTINDLLDATALSWLMSRDNDDVVAVALESMAGLPRDFSALHILRNHGILEGIENGFQRCFHKDTTLDQWRLVDARGAELYCRAWINLTRGTLERWPFATIEQLWMLQEIGQPDAAAMASCAIALSSFDISQWELLSYLAKFVAGELQLTEATQCILLDSIIECYLGWEAPAMIIEETRIRAIPILLRVLHLLGDDPVSKVRSATALALFTFTGAGPVNLAEYASEERRREDYCELSLEALSILVEHPNRFGVKDSLLAITAQALCQLATPVAAQSERFPQRLRALARKSFSQLFIEGRIGVGVVPDAILANTLHIIFPPTHIKQDLHASLVTKLLQMLEVTSHPDV
ncbi:hypothetical protein C8J56DRAFT_1122574, partial [Mycena floridula]